MVSSLQQADINSTESASSDSEKLLQYERDIDRLTRYIEQMHHDISAVEHSRAWRLGFGIMSLAKKLLKRNRGSDSFASIHDTYAYFQHWKKTRD